MKLTAALKLLTVIKNDLDVISCLSKRRAYAEAYESRARAEGRPPPRAEGGAARGLRARWFPGSRSSQRSCWGRVRFAESCDGASEPPQLPG